jgi:hypothetical protein
MRHADAAAQGGDFMDDAIGRLQEAIAILEAIERGDLLAELPSGAEAAARHQCGVSLLAVLRRDLNALADELDSANQVQSLMARLSRRGPVDRPRAPDPQ